MFGQLVDSEWSFELRAMPGGGGRYTIAVHHYRHLGPVSTAEDIEFDTLLEALDWLKGELHA